jgi:DNA recombination protein RmuC
LTTANTGRAAAEANHAAAEKRLAEQRDVHEAALREAREQQAKALLDLREAFKALSFDALEQTHPEFLRLANETLAKFQESAKGDLAQRQQAIATLVKPLEEQLKLYQQRLQQSETSQSSALGEVKQHLESLATQSQSLSNETLQLRRVLSSNQARGRWGEETLRRVVEAAGMSQHCDFSEQTHSGEGKPDLLVHLPGDRVIIVDAKVPDLDFLELLETADPVRRSEALAAHAAKLKATIKGLADRDYPRQFPNALDHVVLFLPAESLFSAALEGDRDLILWAAKKQIMLATPASLIALLRSVSVSWQQRAQNDNAQAICEAAQELFHRVCRFCEHFARIRSGLEHANNAFNEAVGSYDRMVRPSGEKLVQLGAGTQGKSLADVTPIEAALRILPPTEDTPSRQESPNSP